MPRHVHQPRATTTTDATASPIGDVVDRSTGLPRLLTRKCETCIFRPGNLMHLNDGARDDMVRAALASDSWIVCHATLPAAGIPVGEQAICRGFWDVHARDSSGCRLAVAFGGPVLVPPPTEPDHPNA
ncbi:hypothetical protein SAMN04489727_1956 [Amycolatopsis tolypomycina]|uniref:Uncharacterized protein n=1 Tax=Amycolatopsis tolypomycina TaxID=208445 RepID=A0A1H4JJR5_9PSEU|nr:hypothetical protein [Amycolatopsis tolypomycina]SEB46397.1 hypothetical protein SAMN04489727_1956 [Amycolatopsis tolypomycina]